jgi:long-chain fatty acid transport protein
VDDSSAITHNPANLVTVTNQEFQFAPTVVYIKVDYKSPGGQTASTEDPWKALPNLFASMPFYDNRLALGLGITTPYGISNQWDKKSNAFSDPTSLRYQSPYFAQLMTVNFTPTVSVKTGDYLDLGAGVDIMWSRLKLNQFYPWFLATGNPSDPDGKLSANATGVGVGANFGATVHLTDHQSLALTLRTPIRINYEGDFKVNNVPAAFGGNNLKDDFSSSIKFPTIVAAGYGIEVTDTVRVEADVEWLQFSNFKSLPVESTTAQSLGIPSSIPQKWKDTFTVGIAGDWQFAPGFVFRAGYQYYESPVPNSTFSPTIPDANQNVITVGLGFTHKKHSLEAGYGYDMYDTRNITSDQNPALNGKYTMTVHLFSLSYRYNF